MSLNWVTWRRKLNAVLIPSNGKRQEPLTRHEGGRTDATPRLLVVRPPWPSSTSWPARTHSRHVAGPHVEPVLFQLGEHGAVTTVVITNPSSDLRPSLNIT
jgi:hypothetical protein